MSACIVIALSQGGEGVLGSLPAPANPQPEVARARQERGVRGQSENGDGPVEHDGEGDVGRTQHGRPAQGEMRGRPNKTHQRKSDIIRRVVTRLGYSYITSV